MSVNEEKITRKRALNRDRDEKAMGKAILDVQRQRSKGERHGEALLMPHLDLHGTHPFAPIAALRYPLPRRMCGALRLDALGRNDLQDVRAFRRWRYGLDPNNRQRLPPWIPQCTLLLHAIIRHAPQIRFCVLERLKDSALASQPEAKIRFEDVMEEIIKVESETQLRRKLPHVKEHTDRSIDAVQSKTRRI